MIKAIVFFLFVLLGSLYVSAQSWSKVSTIQPKGLISAQSIDPAGRLYIGTSSGNVLRYESDGTESEYFSEIANFPVTGINGWNRFKTFMYFRDPQVFAFIDRFNTTPKKYLLNEYTPQLSTLVTPGIDNSIWVLSAGFNELQKFNIQNKQLLINNPLSIDLSEACYMRAYQNLLIIADPATGLHYFDQFGTYQTSLKEAGISYFQIEQGEMIYLRNDEVVYRAIYDMTVSKKIKAPKGGFYQVIKSGDSFFFIGRKEVELYSLLP